jgi:hypothetical protein
MSDTLAPVAGRTVTITQVMTNAQGPLPLRGNSFRSDGGTLILTASGSGFTNNAGLILGMNVLVDGATVGTCKAYANQAGIHLPFIPIAVALQDVGHGNHVIEVQALGGTLTDSNDFFNVTISEFHSV